MIRLATSADASTIARLLHDFNTEFDTPSPGIEALQARLERLLTDSTMFVALADEPHPGLAVVSLRRNVWFEGPVALLDELYVVPRSRNRGIGTELLSAARHEAKLRGAEHMEINVDEPDVDAQRFYERHGFTRIEPTTGQTAFYYWTSL